MFLTEEQSAKWKNIMEGVDGDGNDLGFAKIKGRGAKYRYQVTEALLENQQKYFDGGGSTQSLSEDMNVTQGGASPLANWDPILISMIRRSMPNLMAFDVCGVQPMSGPTGLIFSLKSRYDNQNGTEALFNVANTAWSGIGSESMGAAAYYAGTATSGTAMPTPQGENLGGSGTNDTAWNDMAFSIDKSVVSAKTRALKADYSIEMAQDLNAIHGLSAESELVNILTTEILTEINREVIHVARKVAKVAAAAPLFSNGTLQVDSNGNAKLGPAGTWDLVNNTDGRWEAERYKSLLMKIHREANAIAKDTRRGRGNFLIVSSDVAAALDLTGKLIYSPAIDDSFNYDDTGNTYVGVLSGRYRVYCDPYSTYNEIIVGYKGASAWDAGFYYCPYVPLMMQKTVEPNTGQPRIFFKTRYGLVGNPFADTTLGANNNPYMRKFQIKNL